MSASAALLTPEALGPSVALANRLLAELDRILLGRQTLHRMTLIGILSQGHILLEGLPGLGKTALVRTLGDVLQLEFKRIQFTPDLMPSDILGTHILQQRADGTREMSFQPGPVFTNLLLADEINRASPKTQSAMLEIMQERSVTLLGETRRAPAPFFVLASQNPIELEGTYPLPEAQLDRFLFRLIVDDIDPDTLDAIIATRRRGELPRAQWTMNPQELQTLFDTMERIVLPRPVSRYIARLVAATHPARPEASDAIKRYVRYGASPRAAIAMAEAARGQALLAGRPSVGFEDVKSVAGAVLDHRLILNYQARFDQFSASRLVADLLHQVDPSDIKLPHDVELTKQA